jgi:hypothetical protein
VNRLTEEKKLKKFPVFVAVAGRQVDFNGKGCSSEPSLLIKNIGSGIAMESGVNLTLKQFVCNPVKSYHNGREISC